MDHMCLDIPTVHQNVVQKNNNKIVLSSGAVTPFGSEAAIYLNGLSHPVGMVLVP